MGCNPRRCHCITHQCFRLQGFPRPLLVSPLLTPLHPFPFPPSFAILSQLPSFHLLPARSPSWGREKWVLPSVGGRHGSSQQMQGPISPSPPLASLLPSPLLSFSSSWHMACTASSSAYPSRVRRFETFFRIGSYIFGGGQVPLKNINALQKHQHTCRFPCLPLPAHYHTITHRHIHASAGAQSPLRLASHIPPCIVCWCDGVGSRRINP